MVGVMGVVLSGLPPGYPVDLLGRDADCLRMFHVKHSLRVDFLPHLKVGDSYAVASAIGISLGLMSPPQAFSVSASPAATMMLTAAL